MKRIALFIFLLALILSNSANAVEKAPNVNVNAKTYVVIDANSGKALISRGENTRMYPASLTKILTSLMLVKYKKMTDEVVVSKIASLQQPSKIGLIEGERITTKDLLYSMMLHSANDSAYAAGEAVGGTIENYQKMMNETAVECGAKNSHFVTPNGLHDAKHYTTALDIALITREAIRYKEFVEAIHTENFKMSRTKKGVVQTVHNKNKLLGTNRWIVGGKTGYTVNAGNCLMEYYKRGNTCLISIVLKTNLQNEYRESKELLEAAYKMIKTTKIHKKGSVVVESWGEKVSLYTKEDVMYSMLTSQKMPEISKEVHITTELPVQKGQCVGTLDILVDKKKYKQIPIFSSQEHKKSKSNFMTNLLILVLATILIKVMITWIRNKKNKNDNENIDIF